MNYKNQKKIDSISHFVNNMGLKSKAIYYPYIRKDSFILRTYYENNKIIDSGYVSSSGFIDGKFTSFNKEGKTVYEYININDTSTINQFWEINGKDTLSGNYYQLRIFDTIKKNKDIQIQIALVGSHYRNFEKIFFLVPGKNSFKLKEDFSNYKEIEYDTFPSLINDGISNDDSYGNYWAKRIIAFKTHFDLINNNYLRGILVEQKDTTINKERTSIQRYLFVNKKISNTVNNSVVN